MIYFVYILSNQRHTVFYTGVTNDLERRLFEHKTHYDSGFTSKYNCTQLLYYEEFGQIDEAIAREKQLKRYRRAWKKEMITQFNPEWKDLSADWFDPRNIEMGLILNKKSRR